MFAHRTTSVPSRSDGLKYVSRIERAVVERLIEIERAIAVREVRKVLLLERSIRDDSGLRNTREQLVGRVREIHVRTPAVPLVRPVWLPGFEIPIEFVPHLARGRAASVAKERFDPNRGEKRAKDKLLERVVLRLFRKQHQVVIRREAALQKPRRQRLGFHEGDEPARSQPVGVEVPGDQRGSAADHRGPLALVRALQSNHDAACCAVLRSAGLSN